jgi:hypothetical protein
VKSVSRSLMVGVVVVVDARKADLWLRMESSQPLGRSFQPPLWRALCLFWTSTSSQSLLQSSHDKAFDTITSKIQLPVSIPPRNPQNASAKNKKESLLQLQCIASRELEIRCYPISRCCKNARTRNNAARPRHNGVTEAGIN